MTSEAQGDYIKLQPDAPQRGSENVSDSQVHQEGIEHIKNNSDAGNNTSQTGTGGDPSGGMARDAGGVSASAYVGSPVSEEQKPAGVVASTVETVRNLLGGIGLGSAVGGSGSNNEEQKDEHVAGDAKSGDGARDESLLAAGGAAAATSLAGVTSAVVGSSSSSPDNKDKETQQQEQSEGDKNVVIASAPDSSATPTATSSNNTPAAADSSAQQQHQDTTMADQPPKDATADPSKDTSVPSGEVEKTTGPTPDPGTDSSLPNTTHQDSAGEKGELGAKGEPKNEESSSGDGEKKEGSSQQGGAARENPDAIPTAGGERLGEKHWGESKIVPDNPPKSSDEGVSSAEGQPDDTTRNNTSKNTGDAPGHSDDAEGKPKLTDKIKDKLHMGKKE